MKNSLAEKEEYYVTPFRQNMLRLQNMCLQCEQLDIELKHVFGEGFYTRECFLPKGTICVGKIHRYASVAIVSKGTIMVATDEGINLIEAPQIIISPPGTKRAAWVLADTVWTTIHATDKTTVEEVEQEIYVEE